MGQDFALLGKIKCSLMGNSHSSVLNKCLFSRIKAAYFRVVLYEGCHLVVGRSNNQILIGHTVSGVNFNKERSPF